MFVGYANDHAGNTFKLLNLKTCRIWKSRDVKWIASSIVTLEEPTTPAASTEDDEEDVDVHAWAKTHDVNVIPDNNDNANLVAPLANADVVVSQAEDDKDEDQAVACPKPATNKAL